MKTAIIAGLTAVLAVAQAQANIIVNGGFESPAISAGNYGIFTSIPGWTSTLGDGLELQNNAAGTPFEGHNLMELDSNNNSNARQSIATTINQSYDLSFEYSPRPGISSASNPVEVYFGGNLIDTLTGVGAGNTVWSLKQYTVVATGASSVLEFRAVGTSDSLGGYIDDVKMDVSPVPEVSLPGVVFGAGFAAMALRRFKARKVAA